MKQWGGAQIIKTVAGLRECKGEHGGSEDITLAFALLPPTQAIDVSKVCSE